MSTSTVLSIKKLYLEERRKQRDDGMGCEVKLLPMKKHGRQLWLGNLVSWVQAYLQKLRESGRRITTRIVMAVAKAIVRHYDSSRLKENSGYIDIGRTWAKSILERMKFVKRKGTTSKGKESNVRFEERKREFLGEVVTTVKMEDVPADLILNWDQTIVPSSSWTMALCGSKRVEIKAANDKRQITAVFYGNLLGDFLPIQVIYKSKTNRCHPSFTFPSDWDITHSPDIGVTK